MWPAAGMGRRARARLLGALLALLPTPVPVR